MKKTFIVATLLAFGLSSQILAATSEGQSQANNKQTVTTSAQGNKTGNTVKTEEQNKVMNQGESTQIQTQEQNEVQTGKVAEDKNKENKGQVNAESHRSAVANFVQGLLAVAEKESGIGQQIKVIAQQQNDIKDRGADLIYAVEKRSEVKTFFIGTSYKNLGELRSQMVQTKNQIEQLTRLAEKAEGDQTKAELQLQIQTLEQEQANIENFITQNENKFSLFGWAVKFFRG